MKIKEILFKERIIKGKKFDIIEYGVLSKTWWKSLREEILEDQMRQDKMIKHYKPLYEGDKIIGWVTKERYEDVERNKRRFDNNTNKDKGQRIGTVPKKEGP